MRIRQTTFLVFALAMSFSTNADIAASTKKMCGKIQTCVMEQMQTKGREMDPNMKSMILNMVEGMCDQYTSPYVGAAGANPALARGAVACIDSLVALDCDSLTAGKGENTPACQDFKKQAEASQK